MNALGRDWSKFRPQSKLHAVAGPQAVLSKEYQTRIPQQLCEAPIIKSSRK